MWESLKENVSTHAVGFVRDITDRFSSHENNSNSQPQAVKNDAMKNVVTPNSIPQFTVPPLMPYDILVTPSNDDETQNDEATSPPSRRSSSSQPRYSLSQIDVSLKNASLTVADHSPSSQSRRSTTTGKRVDQQSQPGLSLSHLLSTKSGFSTLTESPNTRRKESLFLSPHFSPHEISPLAEQRQQDFNYDSSSDSDVGRNPSPTSSPLMEKWRSKRLFGRSTVETDSNNSSNHSTPYASPATSRKASKKKSIEVNFHNTFDGNLMATSNRSKRCEINGKSPTSPSHARNDSHDPKRESVKRSFSAASVTRNRTNLSEEETCSSMETPRIHVLLTYLPKQQKMNISIIEAENFFVGKQVYLKIYSTCENVAASLETHGSLALLINKDYGSSKKNFENIITLKSAVSSKRMRSPICQVITLLPRMYGYHRTEPLKVDGTLVDIRERLTFESVKEEDIPQISLEIRCKEKPSKLRHTSVLGRCITTLCDINKQAANDMWLDVNTSLKEETFIQLSLCYHAVLGFVTVEVISARNIPRGNLGRHQDCYIVLTEEPHHDKSMKKQTKMSQKNKDPIFQEAFMFAMTNDQLVIVATLYVKDRGHWMPKGEVKLGQNVDHWSGNEQWIQALSKESQPVTYWHVLKPS